MHGIGTLRDFSLLFFDRLFLCFTLREVRPMMGESDDVDRRFAEEKRRRLSKSVKAQKFIVSSSPQLFDINNHQISPLKQVHNLQNGKTSHCPTATTYVPRSSMGVPNH